MKFSIGDPVYIKSNDEEGKIIEFISNDMAKVKADEGGSYHVYLSDLEHPYLRCFLYKNKKQKKTTNHIDQIFPEKKATRQKQLPDGVYLVFFPIYVVDGMEERIDKVKIYFYNETENEYLAFYDCFLKNENLFSLETKIFPNQDFYIHDVKFEDIACAPNFKFRFIDTFNSQLDFDNIVTIKPKKLFEYINNIKFDNKAFFHVLLFDKIIPKPKKEVIVHQTMLKEVEKNEENHFTFKDALSKSKYEVDLHIEKLYINYKYLAPSEMLDIQLKEFQNALELAIATHQKSIVFIHGIGKGSLKNEIHFRLTQTKWVHKYVNEYNNKYGYGATEVFFRY
jgi:hypothetical protein